MLKSLLPQKIFFEASTVRPLSHATISQLRCVAYLNSPSTSRCIIMDIVNLPMSWPIVAKTLPNTYLELAECPGRSCRLLRH